MGKRVHGGAIDVLVIEDDPTVRQLIATLLVEDATDWVGRVTPADFDGLPDGGDFALVITDLPTVPYDGAKGRRWVRSVRDRYPGARVVVCTGYDDAEREADHLTADALLPKPFELLAFLEMARLLALDGHAPPAT